MTTYKAGDIVWILKENNDRWPGYISSICDSSTVQIELIGKKSTIRMRTSKIRPFKYSKNIKGKREFRRAVFAAYRINLGKTTFKGNLSNRNR